ncbi:PorT family protein [Vicingus serpentipes]|uniref:PorT family protein n=1 Tax=Vicingus serpentipes TaxID=1926625 RepID=A0A5C6RRT5_9FLAO|nr:porin family protein [Vicingus serpentipes]TXB65071.1 PorT family protein [Vicingus serpentipes]
MQKTKLLTLILFGILFLNLSAQEDSFSNDPVVEFDEERKFRLGLHFSPSISWLSTNSSGYTSDGSKLGFAYGLSTEFYLAKNYLFSTGITINSIGGKIKYESVYDVNGLLFPSEVKQSIKINYVDIPLTIKLKTNQIGYISYYGNFGVNLGLRYQSKSDFEYTDFDNITKSDVNTSSDIKFMNINLVVGGGIEYNLSGNTNIMLGLTYNNGFINVLDSKTPVLNANGKATINNEGNPVYSDKSASANINFFTLNLGVYF